MLTEKSAYLRLSLLISRDEFPFALEILQERGFPVDDQGRESYRLDGDGEVVSAQTILPLHNRRQFAAIPPIMAWADRAKYTIALYGYFYGEGLPGGKHPMLLSISNPLFWEALARAQMWFEKDAQGS